MCQIPISLSIPPSLLPLISISLFSTSGSVSALKISSSQRDTDVQNRLLDSVGEGEGGMFQENRIETCILSRVRQITSPGWMNETSAQGWCTGKTQKDAVWRGLGWGIHVNPWLIHVTVWQNPLQYCKVISLQLIKINEKKERKSVLNIHWKDWK